MALLIGTDAADSSNRIGSVLRVYDALCRPLSRTLDGATGGALITAPERCTVRRRPCGHEVSAIVVATPRTADRGGSPRRVLGDRRHRRCRVLDRGGHGTQRGF